MPLLSYIWTLANEDKIDQEKKKEKISLIL